MDKKVILENLKNLREEILNEMGEGNSPIHKFVFFGFNYPHDFIEQIWGETIMAKHLKSKFLDIYKKKGPDGVMARFYVELDGENRRILEDYIINNYRG